MSLIKFNYMLVVLEVTSNVHIPYTNYATSCFFMYLKKDKMELSFFDRRYFFDRIITTVQLYM